MNPPLNSTTHVVNASVDPSGTRPGESGGPALSVWATGQRPARAQRAGRYVADTTKHPARMLPAVAAYAIEALTQPGDLVFDPMCGAGTTLVEALHLGRAAVGVDVEPHWASLARDNIAHTRRAGVGGYAHVITGDARRLPDVLPPDYVEQMTGRVKLVLTSPPYGAHTHGQVTTRAGRGVVKWDHRYAAHARAANLANQPAHRLLAGMTQILRGCLPLLAPDAHVVITARPWREYGEMVDLPGAITHAAGAAGLVPVQRCVALLAGIRDHQLITRSSFFHRTSVNRARAAGQPWHLVCHEDALVFRSQQGIRRPRRPGRTRPATPAPHSASRARWEPRAGAPAQSNDTAQSHDMPRSARTQAVSGDPPRAQLGG